MARIAIWVIIRRHVWEEGYDPDVGCRLTHEAEGRLDEAADPHNGNVEADSVGRWGNSIKLPCPLHGHQEPRYIHPKGNGAGRTRPGQGVMRIAPQLAVRWALGEGADRGDPRGSDRRSFDAAGGRSGAGEISWTNPGRGSKLVSGSMNTASEFVDKE
jgi:hypothetical protein